MKLFYMDHEWPGAAGGQESHPQHSGGDQEGPGQGEGVEGDERLGM